MARRLLTALAAVLVLGAAAAGAYALIDDGDQGVVPDRLQRAAGRAKDALPSPGGGPPAAQCPAGLAGCLEVSGTIVYVERVDPDGDGDAHFVLADTAGVTGTGITVVDVGPDLRPQPLPGIGDHLSAAGPLETGSYGQRQVAAVALGG
ncbi:MAG TPA: hypothetical protein VHI76_03120 [Solirubrobacterales bacterium]|nr:hypothetical protein [Solirubrobacterales bacterium]